MEQLINVELVFCAPHQHFLKKLTVPLGSSIRQVIDLSQIQKQFMEIDFSQELLKVGVFSKMKNLDYQVKDGDRVEIYRQLYQTPIQARIMRVRSKKRK